MYNDPFKKILAQLDEESAQAATQGDASLWDFGAPKEGQPMGGVGLWGLNPTQDTPKDPPMDPIQRLLALQAKPVQAQPRQPPPSQPSMPAYAAIKPPWEMESDTATTSQPQRSDAAPAPATPPSEPLPFQIDNSVARPTLQPWQQKMLSPDAADFSDPPTHQTPPSQPFPGPSVPTFSQNFALPPAGYHHHHHHHHHHQHHHYGAHHHHPQPQLNVIVQQYPTKPVQSAPTGGYVEPVSVGAGDFNNALLMDMEEIHGVIGSYLHQLTYLNPYFHDWYNLSYKKKQGKEVSIAKDNLPYHRPAHLRQAPAAVSAPKPLLKVPPCERPVPRTATTALGLRYIIEDAFSALLEIKDIQFALDVGEETDPTVLGACHQKITDLSSTVMGALYAGAGIGSQDEEDGGDDVLLLKPDGEYLVAMCSLSKGVQLIQRSLAILAPEYTSTIIEALFQCWPTVLKCLEGTEDWNQSQWQALTKSGVQAIGKLSYKVVIMVVDKFNHTYSLPKLLMIMESKYGMALVTKLLLKGHNSPDADLRETSQWQDVFSQLYNNLVDSFISLADLYSQEDPATAIAFFHALHLNSMTAQQELLVQELEESELKVDFSAIHD